MVCLLEMFSDRLGDKGTTYYSVHLLCAVIQMRRENIMIIIMPVISMVYILSVNILETTR